MSLIYSIPLTNIEFAQKNHYVAAASHAMDLMCTSVNLNKWGLYRGLLTLPTAAQRLTRMQSSNFPIYGYQSSDWRYYFHYQSPPGWEIAGLPVMNVGGTWNMGFSSLGPYTFDIQEKDGEDWVDDPTWISMVGISPATPDHYDHDGITGELLGGDDPWDGIYHNALIGTAQITIDENIGDDREARIVLNHPDSGDGDARSHILSITQWGIPQIFIVNPLFVDFTHNDEAVKRVEIDVGPTYTFNIIFPAPELQPVWLTAIVTGSGTSEGYVDLSVTNTVEERDAEMRVRKMDNGDIFETQTVNIKQWMAPL